MSLLAVVESQCAQSQGSERDGLKFDVASAVGIQQQQDL
jgi:hypothetical protein